MIPAIDEHFDPFIWYRWLFAIVATSYTLVLMFRSIRHIIAALSQTGRYRVVLVRFVTVQLLRLRFRRFASELAQIAALVVLLIGCLWLHHRLGYV